MKKNSIQSYFEDKVALITGGSSGIGLATAKLLFQMGAHVCLLARNQNRLQSALVEVEGLRRNPNQRCSIVVADVTRIDEVELAIVEVEKTCGTPDILINCAGDVYPKLFHEMDLAIARQLMEVDYFGTLYITKACLPSMIARRSGHIVTVSSVYGFLGGYGYSAYCAAKFAVRGFSDALRSELKPLGIEVSIVFPQNTRTPQLFKETELRSPVMKALDTTRIITAEEVARAIVHGIARRQYVILCGTEAKFLFLLTRLLGGGVYWIMDRLVADALKKGDRIKG
jgi:3-dehydrosphinganine reductase